MLQKTFISTIAELRNAPPLGVILFFAPVDRSRTRFFIYIFDVTHDDMTLTLTGNFYKICLTVTYLKFVKLNDATDLVKCCQLGLY